jgi:hypothetical protein
MKLHRPLPVLRFPLLGALVALILLGASAPSRAASAKDGFGELTLDQVDKMVAAKSADIFDNNSEERFAKSHVPGARWVAFNKVTASDLPKDKERSLVFYCENTH